jgi:hypothetical protein
MLLKTERPSLTRVHSQVLQNVAVRLDLAFQAFFQRVKEHAEEPGFPLWWLLGVSVRKVDGFALIASCFPSSGYHR